MARFRCDVCKVYKYDATCGDSVTGLRPGTELSDVPDGWVCPICLSDKTHLQPISEEEEQEKVKVEETVARDGSSTIHITGGLRATNKELTDFARMTGNSDLHGLSLIDLCTVSKEMSEHTRIEHVRPVVPVDTLDYTRKLRYNERVGAPAPSDSVRVPVCSKGSEGGEAWDVSY